MVQDSRKLYWFCGALAVAVLGSALIYVLRSEPEPTARLPDGAVLRLERVDYRDPSLGPPRHFLRPFQQLIAQLTGRPFLHRFANPGSLTIWLSRRDEKTGEYLPMDFGETFAEDEHGCRFPVLSWFLHGKNWVRSSLSPPPSGQDTSFLFASGLLESFPAHEEQFVFRLFDRAGALLAELPVANPSVQSRDRVLEPDTLPAERTSEGITMVLQSVSHRFDVAEYQDRHIERLAVVPKFEIRQAGEVTKDWGLQELQLRHPGGRWITGPGHWLCTNEPSWEIKARFVRNTKARFSSNELWRVGGIQLPPEGKLLRLDRTNRVQGLGVRLIAVAGPGDYAYSNGVPIRAAVHTGSGTSLGSSTRTLKPAGSLVHDMTIRSTHPHVMLEYQLGPGDHVGLRGLDKVGRVVWEGEKALKTWGDYHLYTLGRLTDVAQLDLEVIVHRSIEAQFVIRPPPAPVPIERLPEERRAKLKIQPRSDEAKPELIDLTPYYTRSFDDWLSASGPISNGSGSGRFTLSNLQPGLQMFGGVQFDVRGAVQLSGLALTRELNEFPKQIAAIPVDQTCRRLHFLHGTIWPVASGTTIGRFVVRYANGTTAERPIRYGLDVWDRRMPLFRAEVLVARPVWDRRQLGQSCLFKTTWENGEPGLRVESIDYISSNTSSAPFLIAITAEK